MFSVFGQTYYYYDTYNLYYIDYDYEEPPIYYVPQTRVIVPFQTSYVEFRLYRQNVATYSLLTYGSLQTQTALVNIAMPFKIIIHGYLDNTDNLWIQTIKNQYLLNNDYNVILVDWRSLSYTFYPITTYYDQQVANYVGDFIIDMNTNLNVPYTSIHCIGHSMGAHACGLAGKLTIFE